MPRAKLRESDRRLLEMLPCCHMDVLERMTEAQAERFDREGWIVTRGDPMLGMSELTDAGRAVLAGDEIVWPEWRPIATAPGASNPNEFILVVGGAWPRPVTVPADGDWWRERIAAGKGGGCPTHWLPSPPLPQEK